MHFCLNQAMRADQPWLGERELQASFWQDVAQWCDGLEHRRQRQCAQALHQSCLVLFERRHFERRAFEQDADLRAAQAIGLHEPTQAPGAVKVKRRVVEAQLGAGAGSTHARAQAPGRVVALLRG